jgi:hypothetical protein
MTVHPLPPPRPAPDPLDDELARLLTEPLADALQGRLPARAASAPRERLLERVARSARAAGAFVTVRVKMAAAIALAPGVATRLLYAADGAPRRAGEPRRVRLVELAPGASWTADAPAPGDQCEWLVMQGRVSLDGEALALRDFRRAPAAAAPPVLHSDQGAVLYLRESPPPAGARADARTVRDAGAAWDAFAPGIWRRVLWSEGGEAAMLYHTLPGAEVPAHGHCRDEECLMLDGEVFLDDVLLRRFDYQLAPAGTAHQGVATDTGVVLFAHGDLDLDLHP